MSIQEQGIKYFETVQSPQNNPVVQETQYNGLKITLGVICTVALLATAATLTYMAVVKCEEVTAYEKLAETHRFVLRDGAIIELKDFLERAPYKILTHAFLAMVPMGLGTMKFSQLSNTPYENNKDKYRDIILTMIALAALAGAIYWATQFKAETVPLSDGYVALVKLWSK